jgi:hypothetical protein
MPTPNRDEGESAYVSRCMEQRQRENPGEVRAQSVAICHAMFRRWKSTGSILAKKKGGKS